MEYDIVLIRFSLLMSLETRQFSLTGFGASEASWPAEGYVIKIGIITGSKIKRNENENKNEKNMNSCCC